MNQFIVIHSLEDEVYVNSMPDPNCCVGEAYLLNKPDLSLVTIKRIIMDAKSEHIRAERWRKKYKDFHRRMRFFRRKRFILSPHIFYDHGNGD